MGANLSATFLTAFKAYPNSITLGQEPVIETPYNKSSAWKSGYVVGDIGVNDGVTVQVAVMVGIGVSVGIGVELGTVVGVAVTL